MEKGKQMPGVMLYFDSIRPALNRLDNEQCGALFRAILDYAEYGAVSDLEPMTGMVFDLLRPKIDRDAEKYAESREQRQHAVYVREAKRRGERPLTLPEWRLYRETSSDNVPISPDIENIGPYPSTTISPATATSTTTALSTSSSVSSSTAGEGAEKEEGCKGEGEGEPQRLYAAWLEYIGTGNMQEAFAISNELFKMGYDVDIQTQKISKRAVFGDFER